MIIHVKMKSSGFWLCWSWNFLVMFSSNMATLELCTLHVNIGVLWWYLTTISVRLELLCGLYKTSRFDEGNLTFTFPFRRFNNKLFHPTSYYYVTYCWCFTHSHCFKIPIPFFLIQDNPSDKDINQGTLVVFNLDPSVSNDDLRQIFGDYGEVKEVMILPCLLSLSLIFFAHILLYHCCS